MSSTLESPAASSVGHGIRRALLGATAVRRPFCHWWLRDLLPMWLRNGVRALPFPPPMIDDTRGKRDTHNSTRIFISEANRVLFPACAVIADAFQDEATIGLLEDLTGATLEGCFLRIEYCQDVDGFWLEPHTDIGAKRLTFLIYLSDHPDAENWGTDIMDAEGHVVRRVPGTDNNGLIFVPGAETWHGFARRPIAGVRRCLIVNYVTPEWRSTHELAFPGQPVASGNEWDFRL